MQYYTDEPVIDIVKSPTTTSKMRAIIYERYGPPENLTMKEVDRPIPKENEVLIKIQATTVTAGDCEVRRFDIPAWIWLPVRLYMGVFRPRIKILGQEFAGEVVEVGSSVSKYKIGDRVFGTTGAGMGGYAEYKCMTDNKLMAKIPQEINFEDAATIPTGGINGLHFLRKARIQAGSKLLINGAGGSIGTYAVQLAKHFGAEVTAVDSAEKLPMLKSIGADHVIDYTQEDFTNSEQVYDAIIDVVGTSSFTRSIKLLSSKGHYVLGNPTFTGMVRAIVNNWFSEKKVRFELAGENFEDFDELKNLMAKGVLKPFIDKRYPLEKMVEAHTYVEQGHKKGNLIIDLENTK